MATSENGKPASEQAGRARRLLDDGNSTPVAASLVSKLFPGIRAKLIGIFVLIKVVPLLLLALFAWQAAKQLGESVGDRSTIMADQMLGTIKSVGDTVTLDATRALDERSSQAIERLTTDTARQVAAFLYGRDKDILRAAQLEPSQAGYRAFVATHQRELYAHGPWKLAGDGRHWEPASAEGATPALAAHPTQALPDNSKDFRARPPEYLGRREMRPLYAEITFVGLDGQERVKATTGTLVSPRLADVRNRLNTYARAETYWPELRKLRPGEIFVSEVIGSYVGSRVLGPYTPEAASKAGIAYAPEESAYAGTENPVGRRFRGIVRWATPVAKGGKVVGYVTLALDHDHIRQFTDRIVPTEARYTPIIDAIEGNYAFMWDHKGRAIAHPRDYFIPGYNARTGLPETPWMDQTLYESWQASGKPAHEFLAATPPFLDQSLRKTPAAALVKAGTVALDCRYLNFSPQCQGWNQLTETGGSGSFVIYFSGLWKLTTAAAIPYRTGQYGRHPRGFGIVTVGANVDDFHQAATDSGRRIAKLIGQKDREFKQERSALIDDIQGNLSRTAWGLILSTGVMVALVILVAIWMANFLTRRITAMIEGIHRFQDGDHGYRLDVKSNDEMGELAASYNRMADTLQQSFVDMRNELQMRRQTEEKARHFRAAMDATEDAIFLVDRASMAFIDVNNAACEILGVTREALLAMGPEGVLSVTRAELEQDYDAVIAGGAESKAVDLLWKRRDGATAWLELRRRALASAEGWTIVSVGRDITERKHHEDELRRLNDELERRVEQRTQALHATNSELESFSYSVSHDLRAPLRAINGFSRIIEEDHAGQMDDAGRALLQRVSAAAKRMGQLIEDLLKLSRISRQEIRTAAVNLSALVHEVAEELQAGEPGRRVEWRIAARVEVGGDPGLLRVALQNLVGNAWKYSAKRDVARIEFGVAEDDGLSIYFVRDNGAGFDMNRADKLFGAFQRLHRPEEFPGNGIGLATVARIIRRHGGEVWADSKVDEGATFHFCLGGMRRSPAAIDNVVDIETAHRRSHRG